MKQLLKMWQQIKWLIIALIIFIIIGMGYTFLFPKDNPILMGMFLLFGLVLGGIMMYLYFRGNQLSKEVKTESSHTIVESMKKVFKIVSAEGYFAEIFEYEDTSNVMGFIPSTKKALIQVRAKVMYGFDFKKCVWELDENEGKVRIVTFPEVEIISIEPEMKYYSLDNGIFNKFEKEDHSTLMEKAKTQVIKAAQNSGLPELALEQMQVMLKEVIHANKWKLEPLPEPQLILESPQADVIVQDIKES